MTSFHALDEVAEYDLELAQNARDGGNLPLWYRKEGTLGFANGFPGLGPAMRMWSRSPGSDRLAQLSDVTRCVTKFATDRSARGLPTGAQLASWQARSNTTSTGARTG